MPNPVKNITISDAKTGFLIIERKFRWSTHANSANLGSLTQSFYQFAREVDDGFIASVVFEGKEPHSSSASGRPTKQHQTMKMVCTRNDYETISIYYDTTNYIVDVVDSNNLLLAIETLFERECGDLLSRLSQRIASLVDSVEEAQSAEEEAEDIRSHFAFFAQHLDRVITTAFPPTPHLPPPPPSSDSRDSSESERRDRDRDRDRDKRRDSRRSSRHRDRDRDRDGASTGSHSTRSTSNSHALMTRNGRHSSSRQSNSSSRSGGSSRRDRGDRGDREARNDGL